MTYVSGVPLARSFGREEQPYLYNGKELVEVHGLNEYDSQSRWYYPAICRTTTMDPHTERRYHLSPYAWCSNNFANHIDSNGKDDVFDTRGLFLQHVDNGTDYIMIKNSNGELRNITEFSYCEEDVTNRTMLANVGTYFAQQNGLDQTLDICDIDCEGAIAATDVESDFHQVYMIIINGSISPNANTSNNILNTIEHEKDHVEKGTRGSMAEVYAIIRGIANPTWSKTTDTYKQGIISYLIGFAIDAINHGQFDELKSALTPYLDIINQVIEMRFEDNKFMYGMLQYDITDIIFTPASIK